MVLQAEDLHLALQTKVPLMKWLRQHLSSSGRGQKPFRVQVKHQLLQEDVSVYFSLPRPKAGAFPLGAPVIVGYLSHVVTPLSCVRYTAVMCRYLCAQY